MTALARAIAHDAFEEQARYRPDAPEGRGVKYSIRVGNRYLYSDDTHDLRIKWQRIINLRQRPAANRARKENA